MRRVTRHFLGGSLGARVLRSSSLTTGVFVWTQVVRLASNLILTRLLFPEAFGLMALVTTVIQGLGMFSDVGVTPAILQSRRGDERAFLDTAWTIQAVRGVCLWITACALAVPAAWFYEAPLLAQLLPVAGIALLIQGFNPTALETANRHLRLGRPAAIEIGVQAIGIAAAIALALIFRSVWALIASGLVSQAMHYLMLRSLLPDARNRFRWERAAAQELISFGKWIFLSTICGFLTLHGDKIVMGRWLPLDTFGIYNIGYFLATVPVMLGYIVTRKVLIPVYRESPPAESVANFRRLRRLRFAVTAALLAMMFVASSLGVWAVGALYDPRYALAGPVVVLLAAMQVPQIVGMTYDQAALASGDSRRFFVLGLARAVFTLSSLIVGLEVAGLAGALVAQGVAGVLSYPVVVWLSRRNGVWDPLHDAVATVLGLALAALALALNADALGALMRGGGV